MLVTASFNLAGGLFGAFGILDIVGRWGRVAPMKKKSFDLKKDGGECPELVLSPQVIPNSYWIFLSLEALASEAAPRVESEARTGREVVRAYDNICIVHESERIVNGVRKSDA